MFFLVMVTMPIVALMVPQAYTTIKALKERKDIIVIVNNKCLNIPIQQIPYRFFAIGIHDVHSKTYYEKHSEGFAMEISHATGLVCSFTNPGLQGEYKYKVTNGRGNQ